MFLMQSDKAEKKTVFIAFFAHFLAQNFNQRILTAQKNLLLEGL